MWFFFVGGRWKVETDRQQRSQNLLCKQQKLACKISHINCYIWEIIFELYMGDIVNSNTCLPYRISKFVPLYLHIIILIFQYIKYSKFLIPYPWSSSLTNSIMLSGFRILQLNLTPTKVCVGKLFLVKNVFGPLLAH